MSRLAQADNAYDVMSNTYSETLVLQIKTWKHDRQSCTQGCAKTRYPITLGCAGMFDNTLAQVVCVIMTSNAILIIMSNQIIREHCKTLGVRSCTSTDNILRVLSS